MAQLLFSETGRALMHYHEEISRWSRARKVFDLSDANLRGELWIYLGQYEGNRTPLVLAANGRRAGQIEPNRKGSGFNWHGVALRRGILRAGENSFVLTTESDRPGSWMLGVEPVGRASARQSAVSLDGGRTWRGDAMGPHRLFAGEYLARLYLPDLPDPPPIKPKFVWEDFAHPQLAAMREFFGLDRLVRGKRHTFDKVRALSSFVAKLWQVRVGEASPSGRPATGTRSVCPWNTLLTWDWMTRDTVQAGLRPVAFCVHYGIAMVQCCAALGLYARPVVMEDCHPKCPGGHFCAEVWIPEWEQWVYLDPDHDTFYRLGDRYLTMAQMGAICQTPQWKQVVAEHGPSHGYDPRLATGGFARFEKFQGYRRWGLYPRTDLLSSPGLHPVQHGNGAYRFTGFYWYRDPKHEPRHYFPYYFSDLDALYAPPPDAKIARRRGTGRRATTGADLLARR